MKLLGLLMGGMILGTTAFALEYKNVYVEPNGHGNWEIVNENSGTIQPMTEAAAETLNSLVWPSEYKCRAKSYHSFPEAGLHLHLTYDLRDCVKVK